MQSGYIPWVNSAWGYETYIVITRATAYDLTGWRWLLPQSLPENGRFFHTVEFLLKYSKD